MTLSGMGGPGSPGSVPSLSLVTLEPHWPLIGWWAGPDLPDRKWHWSLLILTIPCLQSCPIDWDFIQIFLVPQTCLQPQLGISLLTMNAYLLGPHSELSLWHLRPHQPHLPPWALNIWPGSPPGPSWPCPLALTMLLPRRLNFITIVSLGLVSSWSVLASDWPVLSILASDWLGGSQEGCVSESHKLVFKALYLLIKPTSEEFVTRTPALFVSLPKWWRPVPDQTGTYWRRFYPPWPL